MSQNIVLAVAPLGFPWQTADPFLFCVHHDDAYPAGDAHMAPSVSLAGRQIGQDFSGKDGWSMYHGDAVPGFPQHPHRGFETITIARRGLIDHSDSMGATARFGQGDVQWMTAGKGVVHSEMFPLVNQDAPNHTELFQIWLNLPKASKFEDAHFKMLWNETIPRETFRDAEGRAVALTIIAGAFGEHRPLSPPPDSWASQEGSDVAIWTLRLDPGAAWTAPAAPEGTHRIFYVFGGGSAHIGGQKIESRHAAQVRAGVEIPIVGGEAETEILMLQGRPIGEPVAQHGPFVMNTEREIRQAMLDYHQTGFGGWPWPTSGPVHPREKGRFAIHADGREEVAPSKEQV
jgi:redox-sensitive bicupin YhaK (pirin superfamily)